MQRQKLIAGNWKMHGNLSGNAVLVENLRAGLKQASALEVAVCVPFPYLAQVAALLSGTRIQLGAQNVSEQSAGAYTGEVSAAMLQDFACRYVIVGHSERRTMYAETSELIARKAKTVLDAGMLPIICVGETLQEREAGLTLSTIAQQLQPLAEVLLGIPGEFVLAYEPVWAIGSGKTATPEQAQAVHAYIRAWLRENRFAADTIKILYGGSMKPANAATLLAQPDIDGGLVGGAALVAEDFLAICAVA